MRRPLLFFTFLFILAGMLVTGCSKKSQPVDVAPVAAGEKQKENPVPAGAPKPEGKQGGEIKEEVAPVAPAQVEVKLPEPTPQENYDAALVEALNMLGEGRYEQALVHLEAARAIQDTEQIRAEIAKLKDMIDRQKAAERAADDIQQVLEKGKPEDASRLAGLALQQFGDSKVADRLQNMKRQADALVAAGKDDVVARRAALRREGDAALAEKNLRAAALAFEQALALGQDAELAKQLDQVRASLTRYDDNRRRAAELRRNPAQLEEAIALLQDAAQAWDTLQVRQEIDEYNLALRMRRDAISVADFEVRGNVGMPFPGRTIAEELLPAFKQRFNLIERGQIDRVLGELRLQANDLADNDRGRREVGRLTGVRYLVLGSVARLNGIRINARMVDVRTGLVVQTARVVARSPEEMVRLLPQLATMLMMNDEQKMALEQQLAQQQAADVRPVEIAPVPQPPPMLIAGQPIPQPIVVFNPRPPDFGGMIPGDFAALPQQLPPGQGFIQGALILRNDGPVKQRLLQVALSLGDNLFQRGRYPEAMNQFELAFNLAPGQREIALRIDRCRPLLPPVIVVPQPILVPAPVVFVPRPRIAVFSFLVNARPGSTPPWFGDWAAERMSAYFVPTFEVVDRAEVFWYMGRMGITVRDVLQNPMARLCLAQALNIQFFAFGVIQETASFNVATYLVDSESGARRGGGAIHVRDAQELNLRFGELVRQTVAGGEEQARLEKDGKVSERLLEDARRMIRQGQAGQVHALLGDALQRNPGNVALRELQQQAEQQTKQAAFEEARKKEEARTRAEAGAARQRRQELVTALETERLKADQEAAARNDAARRAREEESRRAQEQLLARGKIALERKEYPLAIQLFESAVALRKSDDALQELARARAAAAEANRIRADQEKVRLDEERRRLLDKELEKARLQVEVERLRRIAADGSRRKTEEDRNLAAHAKLIDEGQKLLAQNKYDDALAVLLNARKLLKTDDVDRLIAQVQDKQALAKAKNDSARAAIEKQLAEEKTRRDREEAETKKRQEQYSRALEAAQKSLAEKRYEQAVAQYQEAGKLFRTDAVLNGQRLAEDALARERASLDAEKRKQEEEKTRAAELDRLLKEGQTALAAKDLDKASKAFQAARKLSPGSIEVQAGILRVEQAREENLAQARKQKEEQERKRSFEAEAKKKAELYQAKMNAGRTALGAKRFDDAINAFKEAQALLPGDRPSADALKEAETARDGVAAEQKKSAMVRQLLAQGRTALNARQIDAAGKAFAEAGKLAPTEPAVIAALQDLQKMRDEIARADAEKKKLLQADYEKSLAAGKAAFSAKNYPAAISSFNDALRFVPGDKEATALLKQTEKVRDDAAAEQKKMAVVQQLLAQGRAALAARQIDAAGKAFTEASKLAPADPAVIAALQDLQKMRDEIARADAEKKKLLEAEAKKKAELYQTKMNAGQAAFGTKRFDDAINSFKEAQALAPGDRASADALKRAEIARDSVAAEQKKLAMVQQLLAQGRAAFAARQLDAAAKAFTEASKLAPTDPAVLAAMQELQKAKDEAARAEAARAEAARAEAARAEAEKKKQLQANYEKSLAAGKAALNAKNYPAAISSFNESLRLVPGDKDATVLLKQTEKARDDARAAQEAEAKKTAEFNRLVTQGQTAMTEKRFADAVKAYEDALKLQPANADTTKALAAARQALEASKKPPKTDPPPKTSPKDDPKPKK